jgi:hypothetical protein
MDTDLKRQFYIIASICYFKQGNNVRAYKMLRKGSSMQDNNNWALMGSILKREEDSGFYRSYIKRIMLRDHTT